MSTLHFYHSTTYVYYVNVFLNELYLQLTHIHNCRYSKICCIVASLSKIIPTFLRLYPNHCTSSFIFKCLQTSSTVPCRLIKSLYGLITVQLHKLTQKSSIWTQHCLFSNCSPRSTYHTLKKFTLFINTELRVRSFLFVDLQTLIHKIFPKRRPFVNMYARDYLLQLDR